MQNYLLYFLSGLLLFCLGCNRSESPVSGGKIHVNQVGFYPDQMKLAVATDPGDESGFSVINTETKDVVFEGKLGALRQSKFSSPTKIADFSGLKQEGTYVVRIGGLPDSYSFEIKKNVYHDVTKASIKAFYFQRFSTALPERYAGKWSRVASHPDTIVLIHPSAADAKRKANSAIRSPRGWIDAGDYNKYIVNSGITTGTLLSAYEDYSSLYDTLRLDIPESTNNVPDILDEVAWNLRWMLTMQDPGDGGVYHKCTNANFDGFVMPDKANTPRYVVQKGTGAALNFAAVTAQAARIYQKFEKDFPGLADTCLAASKRAWAWAIKNPSVSYDQEKINKEFDPDITTGGYGDGSFDDEFFWAASELLITTDDATFAQTIKDGAASGVTVPSWNQVRLLGHYSLLRHLKKIKPHIGESLPSLTSQLIALADSLIKDVDEQSFNTVMGKTPKDFIWGSNAVAANQSMVLLNAFRVSGEEKYLQYARHNLDYLLGRNATEYSFVTGFGDHTPMHPHHRPSESDGITDPIPGFLVGGPNAGRQDNCKYPFTSPDKSYVDDVCSYASNEVAINWNAPLVYVTGGIEYYHLLSNPVMSYSLLEMQ